MNSQWTTDGVPEFLRRQFILARKNFYTFGQSGSTLHGHFQPPRQVVDVDPAVPRQQRFLEEDPEMGATAGLFERCLDAIAAELPLEFQQVIQRIFIIGVDSYPLRTLCLRIDGIDPDCDPSVEVLADGIACQLARVRRAIVIMFALRVRPVRLHGIGQAIDEQAKVPCRHFRCHLAPFHASPPSQACPILPRQGKSRCGFAARETRSYSATS